MRLTLRTLLAYLDDILEPQDAEDVGKRIQESEAATALMHRVRDLMRRLRLEAPRVEETGKGLDPNTVAEYLDHVLPDDRVPDFERICLESDEQLAEVASCHQILALVLGELAEVDPASREHMYALPQVAAEIEAMEARGPEESSPEDGRSGAKSPPPPRRPRPVVPDYLREPRKKRRSFPWVAAVVLLIGVIAVGWAASDRLGLLRGSQGQGESVAQQEPTTEPTETPDDTQAAQPTTTEPSQPPIGQGEQQPANLPVASSPLLPPSGGTAAAPADLPGTSQPTQEPVAKDVTPVVQPGPSPVESVIPPATAPGPGTVPSTEVPPAQPGVTEQTPPAATGGPAERAEAPQPAAEQPAAEQPAVEQPAVEQPAASPAVPPAGQPQHVGRFASDVSENQVLLQWDPQGGAWSRVPPQGFLFSDHDLLALPGFRPLIALTAGLTIQLREGTQVGLRGTQQQDAPRVTVKFGRIVVSTTVGKPDTRLLLDAGSRSGTLVFVDPESRAAVEMTRPLVAGDDPENRPAAPVVEVYALAGRLIWEPSDGQAKVELKTQSRLTLGPNGSGPAEPVEHFPKWYLSSPADTDRLAAKTIEEAIPVDRPVTLGLREKLDHRKKEVRRLATRCLGYVGDFGPMVAALNDPEQKPLWIDYLEELRESLARGPETAAHVRSALEGAYDADGAGIYRMLWGYRPEQLVAGEDAKLVETLGSDVLAVRRVGFWNLNTITGLGGRYYRPEDPAATRQRWIRAWEKRLANGDIRFKATAHGQPTRPRGAGKGGLPKKEPVRQVPPDASSAVPPP